MLKPLKKNSRTLIKIKYKLKDFIFHQLWQYSLVIASILFCAWVFDKWIPGICFCIAHVAIRAAFDKQFHFNKTSYCLTLTLAIIWFAIPITLPLAVSLLSSIPIAFVVCYFGFITQDWIDRKYTILKLEQYINTLMEKINHKSIYSMTAEELYEHCRSRGLSDADCKIAYFIVIERLKGYELYDAINYSERQAKRKRKQILETIE